jgi:hypothetical protein
MKRAVALLLSLCLSWSLAACGSSEAGSSSDSTESTSRSTQQNSLLPLGRNGQDVSVTLPASFFQNRTDEEIRRAARSEGILSYTLNFDGSVTYTMSQEKYWALLTQCKRSIDTEIEAMLHGDEAVPSFQQITYNDDLSQFCVTVDGTQYTSSDAFNGLVFYMMGSYYQILAGRDPDDIDIVVDFTDAATGDTLDTMSYRDFVAAANAPEQSDPSRSAAQ